MKVKVTQHHIDFGCPSIAEKCALALAVIDMGHTNVIVGDDGGMIVDGQKYYIGLQAAKFVNDFDNGSPVEPFEFDAIFCETYE